MKCLKKKKKKAGREAQEARRWGKQGERCHRAGKVQGYRLEHCSRIREWRSQAKLCREPTMCVREGERQRVRAGGGARAGEGRVGVGRGGAGRGRGEGGGASAKLPGGKDFAALGPLCTAARPPRPASDPPSVDAAAGAAAHSPRKGSVEPPEIFPNDRSRSAANSSFLFWALFPLPLSLSFLEKLAS